MRRLRNAFALGVLVGLVIALVRAVGERRRPPNTAGTGHQALSRPPVAPTRAVADRHAASVPTQSARLPTIVPSRATAPRTVAPAPSTAPPDGDATWVAPVDGACPDGYPVKAKETSRIFHVPGGLSYDRTRPERCYPSPTAAEADGFRAAKR